MDIAIKNILRHHSSGQLFPMLVLAVALISALDYLLKGSAAIPVLYVVPILLAGSFIGFDASTTVSLLAWSCWTIIDYSFGSLPEGISMVIAVLSVRFVIIWGCGVLIVLLKHAMTSVPAPSPIRVHDDLTFGTTLADRLQHDLALARRSYSPLSVAHVTLAPSGSRPSHLSTDDARPLIEHFATQATLHLREVDTVAKVGNDGLIIVLPNTGHHEASTVIARLCDRFVSADLRQRTTVHELTIGLVTFEEIPLSAVAVLSAAISSKDHSNWGRRHLTAKQATSSIVAAVA